MNNRLDLLMARQKKHLVRDTALALLLLVGLVLAAVGVMFTMPPVVPATAADPAPVVAELTPRAPSTAQPVAESGSWQ